MTTKKYRIKKSYISVVMIALLQSGPLLTLSSYASGQDPVVQIEETISNETTEALSTTPPEEPTPVVLLEEIIRGSILEGEVPASTSTPPTPEVLQVESMGTSTEPAVILFSNASSSSDSSFEISTTTEEEAYALTTKSSTEPPSTASSTVTPSTESLTATSTELGEESNLDENIGDIPSGTTTISTGSSVALANILNITNTSLVNSTGSIILENLFNNHNGDLDTRLSTEATSTLCTLLRCNGVDTITAKITAESTIDTTVSLIASSGSNEIHTAKAAEIDTGDVYAGLNLVNIANTTLIDSRYLLVSLNSFGNFNGDIIFPALPTFFSSPESSSSLSDFGNVTTQTNATITNNLNIKASTGENTIGSSTGFIQTGSTDSSVNLYNNTNSTLLGGSSLLLLLKVTGTWLGNLVGIGTPTNFTEYGSTWVLQLEENTSRGRSPENTLISSTTASLTNNVEVLADSGKNITTDTNTSQVKTGDAYASANIINIANTHIIGRNWLLAIITILGDFTGDIAFGRPDLWVGEQVSAESFITNGTELLYRVTVTNKGDSSSSNVVMTSSYDIRHLDIINSNTPYSKDARGNLIFAIGNMAPAESKEITFQAKIKESTPGTPIINTVKVQGDEKDNNNQDNSDTTTITTTVITAASGGGYQYIQPEVTLLTISPQITSLLIQKIQEEDLFHSIIVIRVSSSTVVTTEGTVVEQTIIIKNPNHTEIPSIIFNDFLINENGTKIKTETWDIGNLLANEEVTLTYSFSFGAQVSKGVYTLSSEVLGTHSKNIFFGNNGIVTYIPKEKSTLEVGKPLVDLVSLPLPSRKAISRTNKTNLKSLTREAFVETAYAKNESTESQPSPFQPSSTPLQYILLFAAFSALRIFRKQGKSSTIK